MLHAHEAAVQLRVAGRTHRHAGRAAGARKLGVVSQLQALGEARGRTIESERFVPVSSTPLMEPPFCAAGHSMLRMAVGLFARSNDSNLVLYDLSSCGYN